MDRTNMYTPGLSIKVIIKAPNIQSLIAAFDKIKTALENGEYPGKLEIGRYRNEKWDAITWNLYYEPHKFLTLAQPVHK